MSQAKVDRYKQEKANRKKTMAREKLKKKLYILAGILVTAAFVVWIGWSVHAEKKAKKEQEEMLAAVQSQIIAMQEAAQTANKTTGANNTTGDNTTKSATDNKTTAADKTTTADDKTTSAEEKSSEEETTKAADDSKKE